MQYTDAPDRIKSPALADYYTTSLSFVAASPSSISINCVGIGYTDATQLTVYNGTLTRTITISDTAPEQNGLYLIDELTGTSMTFTHNGTYIGRIGMGTYRTLGTNPTKEIGWYTTTEKRKTLSGQTIPGAGGYAGRKAQMDVRYKMDADVYNDISNAYISQIQKSYPFFILFDDEQHKLPTSMLRFYADTEEPISMLQSSSYRFLYSYKFLFSECF